MRILLLLLFFLPLVAQSVEYPEPNLDGYISQYDTPLIDSSQGDTCRSGRTCLDVAGLSCERTVTTSDGDWDDIVNNQSADDVFCVRPGDYTNFPGMTLTADGTSGSKKYIFCTDSSGNIRPHFSPWEDAGGECIAKATWLLENADHWVISNMTFDGENTSGTRRAIRLDNGSSDGIIHRVYARRYAGIQGSNDSAGVLSADNEANRNTFQYSVSGECARFEKNELQALRSFRTRDNRFVRNIAYDCDASIKIFGNTSGNCDTNVCGTIIEDNDLFNTDAMRTDCNGNFIPNGSCTAAEPIWEAKGGGGAAPSDWIRVYNNRIWGFWGPSDSDVCCLTGSSGGLVNITNTASGDVRESFYQLFQNNIFGPSEDVQAVGQPRVTANNISHIGNIFYNNEGGSRPALEIDGQCDDCEAYLNLFVGNDVSLDITSASDSMGNLFINNGSITGSSNQGMNWNAYYNSGDGGDSTKIDLPNASDANGTQFCYWRRHIWNPEQICIDGVMVSDTSPHKEWQGYTPRSGKGVNNALPGTTPLNIDYWWSPRANEGTAGPWLQDQQPLPTDGPVGFGENATGGEGGQSIVVTSLEHSGPGTLREALLTAGPKVITFGINGTIYPTSQLTTNANTTIDGRGADITLDGTFNTSNVLRIREDNIIVRNIKIENAGLDCIQITGSQTSNVWVDHVTMNGAGDELLSVVSQASNITLSWNKFTGPRFDIPAQDKGIMIGSSTTDTVDNVTLYNNWFDRMNQRIPRSRHAKMHWFNNLIASWNNYAASSSHFADMFLENNIYDAAGSPNPNNAYFASAFGNDTEPGEIRATGNWMLNGATGTERNPQNVFDPNAFYTYSAVVANQQLRDAIEAGAGWEGPSGPGPGGVDTSGLNRGIERGYNRGL